MIENNICEENTKVREKTMNINVDNIENVMKKNDTVSIQLKFRIL